MVKTKCKTFYSNFLSVKIIFTTHQKIKKLFKLSLISPNKKMQQIYLVFYYPYFKFKKT